MLTWWLPGCSFCVHAAFCQVSFHGAYVKIADPGHEPFDQDIQL